jgi:hypothetical protein
MGDLIFRRGKVQGVDAVKARTTVRAFVPESEPYKYSAHSAPLHMGERTICEPWRGTSPPRSHREAGSVGEGSGRCAVVGGALTRFERVRLGHFGPSRRSRIRRAVQPIHHPILVKALPFLLSRAY